MFLRQKESENGRGDDNLLRNLKKLCLYDRGSGSKFSRKKESERGTGEEEKGK